MPYLLGDLSTYYKYSTTGTNVWEGKRSPHEQKTAKVSTGKEIQTIARSLLEYIEKLQFPGRWGKGHIHPTSADLILRTACVRVRIEGVSTHSFRRTALTRMSDSDVPLRTIQSISGHKTLDALQRYLEVSDRARENAIAQLDFD